jgi:hypothetical protein
VVDLIGGADTNVGSVTWTYHYALPELDWHYYSWGQDPIAELAAHVRALEIRLARLEKTHE